MVIFATRAVLDANRKMVDVLHIVGADDDFIARAINRRFLLARVCGQACWVWLAAVLTFFALGSLGMAENNGVASAARGLVLSAAGR